MATKDRNSLKKSGNDNGDSFNLNSDAKDNSKTSTVSSNSMFYSPPKSSYNGDEDKVKTKKDSHSWNKSTLDLGRFGSIHSQEKKLRSGSPGNGMDLWEEELARNEQEVSKTSNNSRSLVSLVSRNNESLLPLELALKDYLALQLVAEQKEWGAAIEYDVNVCKKFQRAIFVNEENDLPRIKYHVIQTTKYGNIIIVLEAEAGLNQKMDILEMIREGDLLYRMDIGKQKDVELLKIPDPFRVFSTNDARLYLLRAATDEAYVNLMEYTKESVKESMSIMEQKSTPALQHLQSHSTSSQWSKVPAAAPAGKVDGTHEVQTQSELQPLHPTVPPLEPVVAVPKRGKLRRIRDGIRDVASTVKDKLVAVKEAASCKPRNRAIGAPPPSTPPQ